MGHDLPLSRLRDHTHTHTHTTLSKTPLDEGPIPDNTQHSQEADIHAPSARIEPAIPAGNRLQIHREATGISSQLHAIF